MPREGHGPESATCCQEVESKSCSSSHGGLGSILDPLGVIPRRALTFSFHSMSENY